MSASLELHIRVISLDKDVLVLLSPPQNGKMDDVWMFAWIC